MLIRGSMLPSELIRPKSYAYVNFQLGSFARLAVQAQDLGVDLWRYRSEEKNSILVRFRSNLNLRTNEEENAIQDGKGTYVSNLHTLCFPTDWTALVQDAWDWMGPHWCDRGQTIWPVKQMADFPLEFMPIPKWMGAMYTAVSKPGAYTQRSLYYAKLFHSLRSGHDPHGEMDWHAVRLSIPSLDNTSTSGFICQCII